MAIYHGCRGYGYPWILLIHQTWAIPWIYPSLRMCDTFQKIRRVYNYINHNNKYYFYGKISNITLYIYTRIN